MTNLALIGYGRMGKEISSAAKEKGIRILKIFTEENNPGGHAITAEALSEVDVCVDFSTPAAVVNNIKAVVACGKNIVVGTTGWYDDLAIVKQLVKERNTGFLYASNFSLGVNIFMNIVANAANQLGKYPEYDVAINEIHHNKKADSPSGTALSLGSVILKNLKSKSGLQTETSHQQIEPDQLHITSTRLGSVMGRHTVTFDSSGDSIELTHSAKSRYAFATGALVAAEWLKGKTGVFTMKDVIAG